MSEDNYQLLTIPVSLQVSAMDAFVALPRRGLPSDVLRSAIMEEIEHEQELLPISIVDRILP